MLTEQ